MLLTRTLGAAFAAARRGIVRARARSLLARAQSKLEAQDLSAAERLLDKAVSIDACASAAHAKLALLLTGSRRLNEALQHYRAAQDTAPLTGEFLESFVRSLIATEAYGEAEQVAQEAVRVDPAGFASWFSAGLASLARHRYSDALGHFDHALAIQPRSADAHANRGIALQNLGRFGEACAAHEAAFAAQPGHPLARFHRALVLLATGDYANGWPEYETRLFSSGATPRADAFPRWDGSNPCGRRILVYGEQALGDEIMFASCVPDLVNAGARCVLECHPTLERLFARSFPQATVYAARPDKQVPETVRSEGIDCAVPVGSLPLYYRRSLGDFPRRHAYLKAEPARVTYWRGRLADLDSRLTVGISWKGGTHLTRTAQRSIPLDEWLPILRVAGVRFVSLQYTQNAAHEARALGERHGVDVVHWAEALDDYDETAALATALDRTITVCTAVAHLCGALGRPLWVMAPTNPEWRYGCTGESMAWYPSARIFRQTRLDDWSDVITRVAHELARHAANAPL